VDEMSKRYGVPPTVFLNQSAGEFFTNVRVYTSTMGLWFDELKRAPKDSLLGLVVEKLVKGL